MAVELPRLYPEKHYHAGLFAALAIVGFVATVLLIEVGAAYLSSSVHKRASQLALSVWSVGPPLWFFFEYFYYFPKFGNEKAGFTGLKTAQDLTAKVWAGIAILLGVLYALQFPK
jgi:hypothetical protein